MKKLFILFGVIFLLTGCTGSYEINFGDVIDEKIVLTYDGDLYDFVKDIDGDSAYVEKELLEENIPSLKDFSGYYDKKVELVNNNTEITLNYSYTYDNFENSFLIDKCFEKSSFINNSDYYYVSLGGFFDCYNTGDFVLKVKSDYEIIEENSDRYEDGYYIWDIKNTNDDNKVELQVSKTLIKKDEVGSKISFKVICWVLLFVVLLVSIFIKKKLDNKNEF